MMKPYLVLLMFTFVRLFFMVLAWRHITCSIVTVERISSYKTCIDIIASIAHVSCYIIKVVKLSMQILLTHLLTYLLTYLPFFTCFVLL